MIDVYGQKLRQNEDAVHQFEQKKDNRYSKIQTMCERYMISLSTSSLLRFLSRKHDMYLKWFYPYGINIHIVLSLITKW